MKLFITGISTDVGKTVASAIIVESLQSDYWKPIQSGDLEYSDTHKVKEMVSNPDSVFHENSYAFTTPASPHLSAELENTVIDISKIKEPNTINDLVIEGAGGLLVPLNDSDTIADLIQPDYKVILVSRHYLGSINHTLLSVEYLKSKNIAVAGIIFSGEKNEATESIILEKTKVKCIGRIDQEPYFDQNVIKEYADLFRDALLAL